MKKTIHKYQLIKNNNIENIDWSQEYVKICKLVKLYAVHVLVPCESNLTSIDEHEINCTKVVEDLVIYNVGGNWFHMWAIIYKKELCMIGLTIILRLHNI